jgi:hypothetical protein
MSYTKGESSNLCCHTLVLIIFSELDTYKSDLGGRTVIWLNVLHHLITHHILYLKSSDDV